VNSERRTQISNHVAALAELHKIDFCK